MKKCKWRSHDDSEGAGGKRGSEDEDQVQEESDKELQKPEGIETGYSDLMLDKPLLRISKTKHLTSPDHTLCIPLNGSVNTEEGIHPVSQAREKYKYAKFCMLVLRLLCKS